MTFCRSDLVSRLFGQDHFIILLLTRTRQLTHTGESPQFDEEIVEHEVRISVLSHLSFIFLLGVNPSVANAKG